MSRACPRAPAAAPDGASRGPPGLGVGPLRAPLRFGPSDPARSAGGPCGSLTRWRFAAASAAAARARRSPPPLSYAWPVMPLRRRPQMSTATSPVARTSSGSSSAATSRLSPKPTPPSTPATTAAIACPASERWPRRLSAAAILGFGVARVQCNNPECRSETFRPFSCQGYYLCPSCSQERTLLFAEFLSCRLLLRLLHRVLTFTAPKILRPAFQLPSQALRGGQPPHRAAGTPVP